MDKEVAKSEVARKHALAARRVRVQAGGKFNKGPHSFGGGGSGGE